MIYSTNKYKRKKVCATKKQTLGALLICCLALALRSTVAYAAKDIYAEYVEVIYVQIQTVRWLELLVLMPLYAGGVFALWRWRKGNKYQRIEYVERLVENLRSEKAMAEVANRIEYGPAWYDDTFFDQSELMGQVDKYLAYLTFLCHLIDTGALEKEATLFEYKIATALKSGSVRKYIWNCNNESKTKLNVKHTTYNLVEYGIEKGWLPPGFWEDMSYKDAMTHRWMFDLADDGSDGVPSDSDEK